MGVVSCCVGVAAERTEAPGRVPEGVKPLYCGQMYAKGNRVIKGEEAERRVKAIEAEGSKSGRWVGRVGVGEVKTGGWVGLVELGWCWRTALAARAMWIVFFIFRSRF